MPFQLDRKEETLLKADPLQGRVKTVEDGLSYAGKSRVAALCRGGMTVLHRV